ncbi:GSCOCG00000371001-RA-CDS [Cotesia congregata]|uniref:Similar to Orct2: Organic cation transporter-like protein (Drosophila melanogaster) n=1 Tax=Cotesia congregata TaxID=51543 RepID=A0A8J2H9D6_COTCN|nr:GSCOCG00000371001-RA-CDS [Cotesia congregata]CAG5088186.1 Similar to Orct2: Organic cation transporter-like protein (Drosophila melanogaster) [Cotesia congregata]
MASVDADLEELMSHIGEFGKYQTFQFCLHVVSGLLAGLHMLTLITVAAVPDHKCIVPGLIDKLGLSDKSELNWDIVPGINATYPNGTELTDVPLNLDSCHYLTNDSIVKQCDDWIYDDTYYKSSRGIEWNFVCSNKWKGAVAQSTYMLGVFTGAVTLGSLADKYGRKIIFCISATGQLILGVIVAFIPEYYTFLCLRFLYGIFGSSGAYITGFVLTMEMVGSSKRTFCGIMFQVCFSFGFVLVALWGFIIKDRMWLQIVYGLHSFILIGHWWLMDESPRWLWVQGNPKEAIKIVQKALKFNGDNSIIDEDKFIAKNLAKYSNSNNNKNVKSSNGVIDLLKTPNLRKNFLNVCLNWFANAIVYYGLSLSSGNLEGNPYLMLALSGIVELPSYVFTVLVMDRVGRRFLVSVFMIIGGVCCVVAASIPKELFGGSNAVIGIVLFGKSCIAISFAVIYNYTAELFPTVLRNTALGVGSMCCRLSGALTPMLLLLDTLDPRVPATTFGGVALISGFLALYLPETAGHPMPETLEDGEKFGVGDTCFTTCLGKRFNDKDIQLNSINSIGDDDCDRQESNQKINNSK